MPSLSYRMLPRPFFVTAPVLICLLLCCFLLSLPSAEAGTPIQRDPLGSAIVPADQLGLPPRYRVSPESDSTTTVAEVDQVYGYPWRGVPRDQPDWRGAGRDVVYFLGYQFAFVALLYVAPESISGWTSEDKKEYSLDKWRENVSSPVWDKDQWYINYVLHPYWGGAYYIRARERGLDRAQSFFFSFLLSTLYEYGAEALFEPVSAQDLVVTPVFGFLVGEYLFAPLRDYIRAKPGELDWSDKLLLTLTDPLGVLNAQTDRLFGVKSTLQLSPVGVRGPAFGANAGSAAAGARAYSNSVKPVWGLQLRVQW